jgi:hypothetical protein
VVEYRFLFLFHTGDFKFCVNWKGVCLIFRTNFWPVVRLPPLKWKFFLIIFHKK